jgi:DNA replication protein DnaC
LTKTAGAGKNYYACALGLLACMQGKSVLFITLADLIIRLKENLSLNQISSLKRKFQNCDLIILDELGYYSFNTEIAELFFNLLSSRELKGTAIITTNLEFDERTKPLGDTKLTGSLVSRVCRRAHIIELEREIDGRMQDSLGWLDSRKKQRGNNIILKRHTMAEN